MHPLRNSNPVASISSNSLSRFFTRASESASELVRVELRVKDAEALPPKKSFFDEDEEGEEEEEEEEKVFSESALNRSNRTKLLRTDKLTLSRVTVALCIGAGVNVEREESAKSAESAV